MQTLLLACCCGPHNFAVLTHSCFTHHAQWCAQHYSRYQHAPPLCFSVASSCAANTRGKHTTGRGGWGGVVAVQVAPSCCSRGAIALLRRNQSQPLCSIKSSPTKSTIS